MPLPPRAVRSPPTSPRDRPTFDPNRGDLALGTGRRQGSRGPSHVAMERPEINAVLDHGILVPHPLRRTGRGSHHHLLSERASGSRGCRHNEEQLPVPRYGTLSAPARSDAETSS
jgi:hypothetical protein